jgi:hypothetical protein
MIAQARCQRVFVQLIGPNQRGQHIVRRLRRCRLRRTTAAPAQAAVHVALGDHDAAFALMTRAIDAREEWLLFIKADPDFDSLHADPRWTGLLRRMHLATD